MIKALKWISVIGLVLTIIGAVAIGMAIRAYPQSNVLGGWGLILSPIYLTGLVLSLVAALGWIVVGLRAAIHLINGARNKNRDNDNGEDQA
ncbi:MAG TPA: hypothetical protein VGO67_15635 [Verrucomicrobiae bacterium]